MTEESKVNATEVVPAGGFSEEFMADTRTKAASGLKELTAFIGGCKMPLMVVVAVDNDGGTGYAWTNAPLVVADDMLIKGMGHMVEEQEKRDAATKH